MSTDTLPPRDLMLQFCNKQQAENMVCLEFDLQDQPLLSKDNQTEDEHRDIQTNRKFRIIDQTFVESTYQFRINGNCHGQKIFGGGHSGLNFTLSGKKVIKSIQDRIISLKKQLAETIKQSYHHKWPRQVHFNGDTEKQMKFYLNQIAKLNKQNQGPFVTLKKQTLVVKLMNFNNRSVALQIEVPHLCDLPSIMNNFNQLVMQEFKILKFFICFDMPLSCLNRIQAESISDLDNYLMAKSILPTLNSEESAKASTDKKGSEATVSNGTPITNLLQEFQAKRNPQDVGVIEEQKDTLRKNLDADAFSHLQTNSESDNLQRENEAIHHGSWTQTSSTSHTSGLNTAQLLIAPQASTLTGTGQDSLIYKVTGQEFN